MILARFGDLTEASAALGSQVVQALRAALAARGVASLALPGGRTPLYLFEHLRGASLDWSKVGITLTDERWVPEHDAASNIALLRKAFSSSAAASARLVALHDGTDHAAQATDRVWQAVQQLASPFDAVVLGMGEDGHFASLFPGNESLADALDAGHAPACVAMRAPAHPRERISLNLSALLRTRRLFLLITGQAKLDLLMRETQASEAHELPVTALLAQRQALLEVFWSPS